MRTLIGSKALQEYFPEVVAKDVDYFSDEAIPGAETFYHPRLEEWAWGEVASVDELFTLKVSHAFWKLREWKKHMSTIDFLLQKDAKFIPELYGILYPIWEERYGQKRAKLDASAEEFFNKHVKRVYEHDSIHRAIAFGSAPLFEAILKEGSAVAVSKTKFDALSLEDKLKLVREEVFATALERQVIPHDGKNWRSSYGWALEELITSYSKGWFPLFVVLHFDKLKTAPFNYYEKMLNNSEKLIPLKH